MIIDMKEHLIETKKGVASAIADEKRLERQMKENMEKSKDWEKKAMLAVFAMCIVSVASASQSSFADNGDGTVTDHETDLMWVKDGNSAGCNYGDHAQWPEAVDFCKNLTFAGYSDWRLPSRKELTSIVDKEEHNLSIDTNYFPNTHAAQYWTSTKNLADGDYAWSILFFYGGVPYYDMVNYYNYVRCVRND